MSFLIDPYKDSSIRKSIVTRLDLLSIFYPIKVNQEALNKDASTAAGTLMGEKYETGYK